jgi:hypothetical protein
MSNDNLKTQIKCSCLHRSVSHNQLPTYCPLSSKWLRLERSLAIINFQQRRSDRLPLLFKQPLYAKCSSSSTISLILLSRSSSFFKCLKIVKQLSVDMAVELNDTSAIIKSIDCLDRDIPVKTSSISSLVTQPWLLRRFSNYFISYFFYLR